MRNRVHMLYVIAVSLKIVFVFLQLLLCSFSESVSCYVFSLDTILLIAGSITLKVITPSGDSLANK